MKSFHRRFVFHLWPWYLAGFVALIGTTYITLEIPNLAKKIVNAVDSRNFDQANLKHLALVIIVLGVAQIFIRSLSRVFIFWPGRQLEMNLKNFLFGRLMRLPESFYSQYAMGDLISRIANDVGHIRVFYAFGLLQFLNLGLLLVFAISMMLKIHVMLTIVVLAPLLLMLVVSKVIMPKMHELYNINQAVVGNLTNRITEAYVNVHVIKANAAEQTFLDSAEVENRAVYDINIKLLKLRMFFWPLLGSTHNLSILAVMFYGGYLVIHKQISVGDILALNLYVTLLAFPLTAIGIVLGIWPRAKSSIKRIGVIDEAVEEASFVPNAPTQTSGPVLRVHNLSFCHGEHRVLQNLSFEIREGERIGIFGPVGSGKSTLFNLIARIHEPPKGTIFVCGQDVLEIPPEELRNKVGFVEQSAQLLSMTIRENMELGLGRAVSDDEAKAALVGAQIYDEIMSFPAQWHTQIGEKGVRLSGGQKQRLALARFFLRQPKLLILDDILSAVDHSTETSLINHIFSTKSAALIASHRVSALKECDKVIILSSDGEILACDRFATIQKMKPHLLPQEEVDDAT